MEDVKRILAVSRSTKCCRMVLRSGISLARKYGAELYVMHVIHDPFSLEGWNLPVPSIEKEFEKMVQDSKAELDKMVREAKEEGLPVTVWVRDGEPDKEIIKAVEEEDIDLVIMPSHQEGRLEHFLFGKTNDIVMRKLPTSILLVKTRYC